MLFSHPVHIKNTWGELGQLGHGVFIGFALPQLFKSELGQLGQGVHRRPSQSGVSEILCRRLQKFARKGFTAAPIRSASFGRFKFMGGVHHG